MPTEAEIQATEAAQKIVFSPEQQAKVDQLIQQAMGRAAADTRAANESLTATKVLLETELAAAKETLKAAKTTTEKTDAKADIEALRAEMREAATKNDQEKARILQERDAANKQARELKESASLSNKRQALLVAAGKLPFFDVDMIINNTKDEVKLDESTGKYVVIGEHGQPKMNSAYEPMGLEEFYQDYASKKPFLVRGDVKPGTSSTGNTRFDVTPDGKYPLETLFGPKSNAVIANQFAIKDPKEYRRLKDVAVAAGVIPPYKY